MARKPASGPAADPELLILSSLASGPKHGYAIMSDIEAEMDITLGPGTLYTAISRPVEQKLIAPAARDGRQRPYRLTAQGAATLEERFDGHAPRRGLRLRRLRNCMTCRQPACPRADTHLPRRLEARARRGAARHLSPGR